MARLQLLLLGLACVLLVAASEAEPDEVAALLAFRRGIFEDSLAKLSDWNSNDTNPCSWSGVSCLPLIDGRVVTLELSNSSLTGFLAPEIGSLSSLKKLLLDHNLLTGSIPRDIGKLQNLTVLNLSTNQLAGPIPSEIGDLRNISTIDLHANRLNGVIPPELGKLPNLVELRLSNNSLTGTIPGSNSNDSVISIEEICDYGLSSGKKDE